MTLNSHKLKQLIEFTKINGINAINKMKIIPRMQEEDSKVRRETCLDSC
jgi:hypothetical protein